MRLQKKLNYFSSRQNPGVHEAGRVQKFDILSPELGHGWQNLPPTDISRAATDISRVATDISRVPTDISHAATDISHVATDISRVATDISRVATDITRAATDISRVATDISRVATDITRAATDISHAATDISHVPTEISHALTDVSPRLTFASARPIYWGFEIKWVFPGGSGSRCRRRFQPGDAISATGQASGIKPRKIRNTLTGYFQGDRLRPSGTPPGEGQEKQNKC